MKTRFVHIITAILSIVASDALGQRQIGPLGIQTGRGVYQVTGNYYLWGSGVLYFPLESTNKMLTGGIGPFTNGHLLI
jgi:hypothetical protein